MAVTRLTDVIEPQVYMDYESHDSPEKTAFFESGIIVRNAMLDAKANTGGRKVELPFWNDLDSSSAENISSDDPAQTSTPDKIGASIMEARIGYFNKSWSTADLVSEIAGSSPMKRIRARTDTYWRRRWQRRLIASVNGVLADNIANDAGDMVVSTGMYSRAAFVAAMFTMGDRVGNLSAMAIHSAVYKQMIDNDDIEFVADSTGKLTIPTYMGKTITVDDNMPAVSTTVALGTVVFTSAFFAPGAWGYGVGSPEMPVEVDRMPSQGNGAGVEALYERKTYILHPTGFSFTSASVAGMSPTGAELALAANWNRIYDRKSVPMAFLKSTLTAPTP